MEWKSIDGYKWPYRISETGIVQKFYQGKWVEIHATLCGGRGRAMVRLRTEDNKRVEVPVVWLMADAFMGGRRPGYSIIHRNGAKLDNDWRNLKFIPRGTEGKYSGGPRKRTVLKIDQDGEVVAIYRTVTEAAKKNFISKTAVWHRCTNKVKDPYRLDGFNYQYEEKPRKPRRASSI